MTGLLAVLAAYVLGSLPFGYWLPRLFRGEDIRESVKPIVGNRCFVARSAICRAFAMNIPSSITTTASILLFDHDGERLGEFLGAPDLNSQVLQSQQLRPLLRGVEHRSHGGIVAVREGGDPCGAR